MTILVDTREKNNTHLTEYWDSCYDEKVLVFSDEIHYSVILPKNESLNIPRDCFFDNEICVERKGSAEELSGNLTKERDRLEKELSLAPKNKVILLENCSYVDIATGNYNTQYNKKSYWASLHSFWHKYSVPIMFMPDNKYSGLFIRGYFEYYLKYYLR